MSRGLISAKFHRLRWPVRSHAVPGVDAASRISDIALPTR